MIKFVPSNKLTEKDKQQISEFSGRVMLWILERRSVAYMAEQSRMNIQQLDHNIDQMLYDLRKQVGRWRFFKILFWR